MGLFEKKKVKFTVPTISAGGVTISIDENFRLSAREVGFNYTKPLSDSLLYVDDITVRAQVNYVLRTCFNIQNVEKFTNDVIKHLNKYR